MPEYFLEGGVRECHISLKPVQYMTVLKYMFIYIYNLYIRLQTILISYSTAERLVQQTDQTTECSPNTNVK